jgi:antibiotic biosynthesis monooxygenase (ABM) superfamily enzyme
MGWIKRTWTPHEADEWTKEDWIAIVLSPLSFIFITFGLAMSLFLLPLGFVLLLLGLVVTAVMFWVIGPKLDVISEDYEHKQREYLEDLEKIQRWEEQP